MEIPSVDDFAVATRNAARAFERSVPFNRAAASQYLQQLADASAACPNMPALVRRAIDLALELRPSGPDRTYNVLIAATATCTANGRPPTLIQQVDLVRVASADDDTAYADTCMRLIGDWIDPDSSAALESTNAVILTARTGHPRAELDALDALSSAVSNALDHKHITVHELALGEANPRPPVAIDNDDREAIDDADLVVAALQPPSVGVGISLGYACRHAPVIILLNQRHAPLPPLGVGMPWDTELVEFERDDHDEAASGVEEVVRRRSSGILDSRDRRIERAPRWAPLGEGQAGAASLPDWFPTRRLNELRTRPGRAASASAEELDALCRVLGIPWRALTPDVADLEISEPELKTVFRAADQRKWPVKVVEKIVFSVNDTRTASLGAPMADRADITLAGVQDVVLYAIHQGIVDRADA